MSLGLSNFNREAAGSACRGLIRRLGVRFAEKKHDSTSLYVLGSSFATADVNFVLRVTLASLSRHKGFVVGTSAKESSGVEDSELMSAVPNQVRARRLPCILHIDVARGLSTGITGIWH